MSPWTTQDILEATQGTLVCGTPECTFGNIAIDSRQVAEQDVFIAIRGENHDGHTFIDGVLDSGIRGLIIESKKSNDPALDKWKQQGLNCVAVNDTTRALGDLARYHCRRLGLKVIAITGSNGKTTTRAMTAAVVAEAFCTLSTQGNFNNEIGLPLTLLRATTDHEWAVVELGMNHLGEIRRLAQIAEPKVGIITNIAPAHLEGLGSIENVTRAKGELLEGLPTDGIAVLNHDDPNVKQLAATATQQVIWFGQSVQAAIRAKAINAQLEKIGFELTMPAAAIPVTLNTPGVFMVSNALAAAAAGFALQMTAEQIKRGLEKFTPVPGRLNILHLNNGGHIIDDTYNANPSSMQAAVKTLCGLGKNQRRMAVLGDMNELGEHAIPLHRSLGTYTAKSGVDRLYICGRFAEAVAEGAYEAGIPRSAVQIGTKEEIADILINEMKPQDWILVKGSHAVNMDQIVTKLSAQHPKED